MWAYQLEEDYRWIREFLREGLRRAQRFGATVAMVSWHSAVAHAKYESVSFAESFKIGSARSRWLEVRADEFLLSSHLFP